MSVVRNEDAGVIDVDKNVLSKYVESAKNRSSRNFAGRWFVELIKPGLADMPGYDRFLCKGVNARINLNPRRSSTPYFQ